MILENAALICKDLIDVIYEERIDHSVSMKALSIIIYGLGDKTLRTIQDRETAYNAWTLLHNRCAGESIVRKLRALNNILNCRYKPRTEFGDYVAPLESQFAKLMATASNFGEAIRVSKFLSSLADSINLLQ